MHLSSKTWPPPCYWTQTKGKHPNINENETYMILPHLVSNNLNKKVKSQKQTSPFSTFRVHYQMIPLVVESMVAT